MRSLLLAAVLVLTGYSSPRLQGAEPGSTGLSISVSFSPAPSTPDAYLCKAEVIDLSTEKVLAKPEIINRKGEASKIVTGRKDSEFTFEVSLNKEGTIGEYTVTCQKNGKIISVHKASIAIR